MAYFGSIKVSDLEGWTKTFPIEKARLTVGSAATNDIALSGDRGGGVAQLHMQIFTSSMDAGLRVINLAKEGVPFRRTATGETSLIPPGFPMGLGNGDVMTLGSYTLEINLHSQGGVVRTMRSANLGLRLELPGLKLPEGGRLAGKVIVSNLGNQPRCQFELELEGLPAGCYQIDPAPLLFPGVEEHLQIRFFHRGFNPAAGVIPFTLHATAPTAYPTEAITIAESLEVSPVYRYELSIDEIGAAQHPAALVREEPRQEIPLPPLTLRDASVENKGTEIVVPPVPQVEPLRPPTVQTPEPPQDEEWFTGVSPVAEGSSSQGVIQSRQVSGRKPAFIRTGQSIPIINAPPEAEAGQIPPAGEQKKP